MLVWTGEQFYKLEKSSLRKLFVNMISSWQIITLVLDKYYFACWFDKIPSQITHADPKYQKNLPKVLSQPPSWGVVFCCPKDFCHLERAKFTGGSILLTGCNCCDINLAKRLPLSSVYSNDNIWNLHSLLTDRFFKVG